MTPIKIDFIGVGGEKCASTWLYKCLLEHPSICGPKEKELIYFDAIPLFGHPPRPESRYQKNGLAPFAKFFAHCPPEAVTGEFTSTYLHDKNAAHQIKEAFPDVKILILLRHPVDRVFSQYQGAQQVIPKYPSFEDALQNEPELKRRSLYTEYVNEYLKLFSKENVFIRLYDDVESDPRKVVKDAFDFLNVDSTFDAPSTTTPERTAEQKQLLKLRQHFTGTTIGTLLLSVGRATRLSKFFKKLHKRTYKKPGMAPETRTQLLQEFRADTDALEKLLDRDLSAWKK